MLSFGVFKSSNIKSQPAAINQAGAATLGWCALSNLRAAGRSLLGSGNFHQSYKVVQTAMFSSQLSGKNRAKHCFFGDLIMSMEISMDNGFKFSNQHFNPLLTEKTTLKPCRLFRCIVTTQECDREYFQTSRGGIH